VRVDPALPPRAARLVVELTCSLACVRPPDHLRVCFVPGHPTHVHFQQERDATGQKRFDTNRVTIPAAPLRELLFPAAPGLVRTTAGLSGGLMALASSLITVVSFSTRVSSIVLVACGIIMQHQIDPGRGPSAILVGRCAGSFRRRETARWLRLGVHHKGLLVRTSPVRQQEGWRGPTSAMAALGHLQ
jgi:hypothetical protein